MFFVAFDLVSGNVLDEVPLELAGELTAQLKGVGEGTFRARYFDDAGSLIQEPSGARYWEALLVPGKTGILVCDDDWSIVWAGEWIERQRGVKASYAGFPARTLENYFWCRYKGTSHHVGADQASIFRAMIQEANVSGMGFEIDAPATGVLRERHYSTTENAMIGDRMTALSNVVNGFDWRVDVLWRDADHTGVRKIVRLGYPWLGNRTTNPEHEFELGVNIQDALYTERWGSSDAATHVLAVGDGDGDNRLLSTPLIDAAREAAGWPRREIRRSYSGVTEKRTIDAHAERMKQAFFGGQDVLTVEARNPGPDENFTRLSEISLGDNAVAKIVSPGFSISVVWPVVGWSLDPDLIVYRPTLANLKVEAVELDG